MVSLLCERYTHSDHQAVCVAIGSGGSDSRRHIENRKTGIVCWSTGAFKQETFLATLEGGKAGETEICDVTIPFAPQLKENP